MTARNDGEVQGLREHGTARRWLAAFVLVVTAVLVPSGQALAVDQAMEPNSILAAESFVGAQMTAPGDGRLRGYGFAATITSTGTADGATRLLSTFRPAAAQRLVAFALRFDLLRGDDDTSHPVRATLVVDGRRSALDDGDFVSSGERMYAASVPGAAEQVDLEVSAAGLTQAFSITDGRRVGDQPVVLYRDPAGPDVVSDVNEERNLSATNVGTGAKGAVSLALKGARLSYFSPGEPVTTAGSPNQAFLIVDGAADGVQPRYGSQDYGRYFSDFVAVPGRVVKAHLADGVVVEARHAGSDEGLLGGSYYFEVPADLAGARITIDPGIVEGSEYRGFIGEPARITIEGSASFDVPFGAPSTPPSSPSTTAAAPARRTEQGSREPTGDRRESRPLAPALGALVAVLLVAGYLGVRRRHRVRRHSDEDGARAPLSAPGEGGPVPAKSTPEPERLRDVAGTAVALDGPGAEDAARAAVVDALTQERGHSVVVVLASGRAANLIPAASGHPAIRLVADEDDLLRELDVLHLQRRRSAMEAAEEATTESLTPSVDMLVVAPGPVDAHLREAIDDLDAAVLCIGPGPYPLAEIGSDGAISDAGQVGRTRRVVMMTRYEASAALARMAAPQSDPSGSAQGLRRPGIEHLGKPGIEHLANEPSVTTAISVRLLGPYRISVGETEVISGLRAKARELLAFLASNRDGVTMDAAIEALWPGADPAKGQSYFRTVVANLRTTLRAAAGLDDAVAVVERLGPRYRLDAGLVVVDLWRFNASLAGIKADGVDLASREQAAEHYQGEFATGEDFAWAEPIREQLRRQAIDNVTALAEWRRTAGDLDGALRTMERAIEFDPYAEDLYRVVIELQLSLGRRDAARRTLRFLEQRLADLNSQPAEAIRGLLFRGPTPIND